jgi:hypothetical protein
MKIKKVLLAGLTSGLIMGIALFLSGAIASRIVYGPQMVPEGKFEPDQINAFYFFWTKLVIGGFFGIIFTLIYSRLVRYMIWFPAVVNYFTLGYFSSFNVRICSN